MAHLLHFALIDADIFFFTSSQIFSILTIRT